jgi:hypothetical protein
MTVTAQLSDGTVLEFPDGTKDEVIDRVVNNHVKGMTPQEPSRAERIKRAVVGDDPLRQLALGARGVAEGALTLPVMAGDALNSAVNYGIKGVNAMGGNVPLLPMASSALPEAITAAGAPTPETPQEKLLMQINKGGAAGAAFPALLGHPAGPLLQGVSGGLSSGVTQAAENVGVNPVVAAGAGAVAGMAVPSSPDVLGILKRGAPAAVQPFSQGGREEVVGNALARLTTRPREALANLAGATDDVSQLTTAQAEKDPGLLSTERALANLPGSGGRITNRYADQNEARKVLLDGIAKSKTDLEAAKSARSATAESLYEPAFNSGPIKPPEELIALSKRPAFEAAAKKASEIAGNEGLDLGSPLNTMKGLHYLKKGVDDLIEGAKPGTNEFRALVKMKNDLLGVMDNMSPAYKTAREQFAKESKPINQMDLLQEIKQRTMNSGLDAKGNRVLSQAKWTNVVTDKADELKKVLSPEQMNVLGRISRDLDYGQLSAQGGKVAGSNTFQNLSVANVLGSVLGKEAAESPFAQSLLRPLGFLYHLPERQVEELMIEAMLDKNLAMRLMSKATEKNVSALASGLSQRMKANAKGSVAGQLADQ